MKTHLRFRALIMGLIVLVATTLQAATPLRHEAIASPVEGTRWAIRVVPDETAIRTGRATSDETLVFEGGRVVSRGGSWGRYDASPYSLLRSGAVWRFRAEQYHEDEGRAEWAGEIVENSIRGTITCVRRNGKVLKFAFEGHRTE